MNTRHLLLLDLDGVVALECGPPLLERPEILRLHSSLQRLTRGLCERVVVLTHRSRAEAEQILEAVGLPRADLAGLKAAEDIFAAGLHPFAVPGMVRRGLRKDLVLPGLLREHAAQPSDIVFIDDVVGNLDDLLSRRIGLAVHAPSEPGERSDGFISFDLEEAIEVIQSWRRGEREQQRVSLTPRPVSIEAWRRTGLCTNRARNHLFNRVRTTIRRLRAHQ